MLEINWNEIMLTFNDNKIDLPKIVIIKMQDNIRVRRMINQEPLNFHMVIRQGITCYNLETEIEAWYKLICMFYILDKTWHAYFRQNATSCMVSSGANSPVEVVGCGSEDYLYAEDTHF